MFNRDGDEYRRYDVLINDMPWSDIVTRLITHNIGIAVAYIDRDTNKMIYNPPANAMPAIQALITISKENNTHSSDDVKALVS